METDMLATVSLTENQAVLVRNQFYRFSEWDEVAETSPLWAKALKELPDKTTLRKCTPVFQDMVADAIKRCNFGQQ